MLLPQDDLRLKLNESIPEGGTEADTRFTDEQIQSFLDQVGSNPYRAAYVGWMAKAAIYADLITVNEGNALRQMSDLHNHALAMAKLYASQGSAATAGRTTIGRIRRTGWGW